MPLFSKHSDQDFERLRAERDAAQEQLKSLTQEHEVVLAQLRQVQEELETFFLKNKTLEDAAAHSAADAAAMTLQIADLESKLGAESARANAENTKHKDLQEENDLLLAQLHQVQEELERYYLRNKDLEQTLGDTTTTLQRARYALVGHLLDTRGHVIPPPSPAPAVAAPRPPNRMTRRGRQPTSAGSAAEG